MIVSIVEDIQDFFNKIPGFIEKYSTNPLFWTILVLVLVAIGFFTVNSLGDK